LDYKYENHIVMTDIKLSYIHCDIHTLDYYTILIPVSVRLLKCLTVWLYLATETEKQLHISDLLSDEICRSKLQANPR